MNYLFFDTETTGFFSKSIPLTDPKQVKMVQLGAILANDEGHVLAELNVMAKCIRSYRGAGSETTYSFEVPEVAAAIHGITTAKANQFGIPVELAMHAFAELVRNTDVIIAHNFQYDDQIMVVENEFHKIDWQQLRDSKKKFCTMVASTDILKLPSSRGGYKWPKLQEAFKHFFGEEFECAHDAMADVRACAKVFFALKKEGHVKL